MKTKILSYSTLELQVVEVGRTVMIFWNKFPTGWIGKVDQCLGTFRLRSDLYPAIYSNHIYGPGEHEKCNTRPGISRHLEYQILLEDFNLLESYIPIGGYKVTCHNTVKAFRFVTSSYDLVVCQRDRWVGVFGELTDRLDDLIVDYPSSALCTPSYCQVNVWSVVFQRQDDANSIFRHQLQRFRADSDPNY